MALCRDAQAKGLNPTPSCRASTHANRPWVRRRHVRMVRGDVTAARAPSRKREQGRQMCRCRCHRRRGRVWGGAGAAGAAGEPGRVERGPGAVLGWGALLATSGHPSCAQASVSLSAQWIQVQGAGVGATCVTQNRALPWLGFSFCAWQGRGVRGYANLAPTPGFC